MVVMFSSGVKKGVIVVSKRLTKAHIWLSSLVFSFYWFNLKGLGKCRRLTKPIGASPTNTYNHWTKYKNRIRYRNIYKKKHYSNCKLNKGKLKQQLYTYVATL